MLKFYLSYDSIIMLFAIYLNELQIYIHTKPVRESLEHL